MTDINQNFSLMVRNDIEVLFDIGPDDNGTNLDFVQELSWKAYAQHLGVADLSAPLITKDTSFGILVTDPLLMTFTVIIDDTDTNGLSGNYYHQVRIIADHGAVTTAATGLMTVIDPMVVPNVLAFKSMFPIFAGVNDTVVQIALDEAGQFVDQTWDYAQSAATMYLAAHFLSMATTTSDTSGQLITSETIGRISVSYASTAAAGVTTSTLGQTSYGIVFSNMLTAQGGGIAIV